MEIKSIKTTFVTERPGTGLINPEFLGEFTPYFASEIVSDRGTFRGQGETEYAAEQDAFESLKADLIAEAHRAMDLYNVRNGAGNLEIA